MAELAPLICTLIRSPAEIAALQPSTADLTATPEYFLARLSSSDGIPAVIAVREVNRLIGIVYGTERAGVVECGDYYGDGGVAACDEAFAAVAHAGLRHLLRTPGIHTVRFNWKPGDHRNLEIGGTIRNVEVRHNLFLDSTFDNFLARLGRHTRRNLRYYRRHGDAANWNYIHRVDPAEVELAFQALDPLQTYRLGADRVPIYQAALRNVPGGFCSALQSATGEWVALAGGWVRGPILYIGVQLNHAGYKNESVSIVLRSHLIEHAIAAGIAKISFLEGCSAMLRRYCRPERCIHLLLQSGR